MNKFSLRIFLLLVISSLILGLVAYQVTLNIKLLITQNAQIDRSNQFLIKLGTTMAQVREAQALERGYLLTDQKQFLAKYRTLSTTIQSTLLDLQSAVNDDNVQHDRAQKLTDIIRERVTGMDGILATYETQGAPAAIEKLRAAIASVDNEALPALVSQMELTERGKLNKYRDLSNTGVTQTIITSAGGALACIIIFLLLFWLIDREGVRRSRSEQSLQRIVEEMEHIQLEMQQMSSLTDYLQSCREMHEIYALAGQHLAPLFPGVYGALGVHNHASNVIELVASWGNGPKPDGDESHYFLPEDCWALRRGAVHVVHDKGNEPRCPHATFTTGDSVCFPMVAHGETIGVLYVAALEPGVLDVRMQRLLRTASEHISMAIANMRLEITLRMQSLRDPLTQLYNRRHMESSLEREIFRAKRKSDPISILIIDIDHFKRFNDTFGHEAGDMVLKEFAKLLLKSIRGEDIACRFGGEEFVLILPGCALHIAMDRAERLRTTMMQQQLTHNGNTLGQVTLSIGVLCYPEHSDDPTLLIKKADEALYRAKNGGRNRVEVALAG